MAIYHEDIVNIELQAGTIHRSFLMHSIGSADSAANRFGVRVFRSGEPVDLTGCSCQGYFRDSHGNNIALTSAGTVSGNVAYVTLPQACYNYPGQFCLAIKLIGGGITGTVRIVDGMVDNTHTGGAVAPTETVPTYQEILATYGDMVDIVEDYEEVVANQDAQISDLKSTINPLLTTAPTEYLTEWTQGTISSSGSNQSSTTRCRSTGYKRFNYIKNNRLNIIAKTGYKFSYRVFSSESASAFVATSDWITGSFSLTVNPNYYYRFVIAYTGDTSITPSSIASDALGYNYQYLVDETLTVSGAAADAQKTGEIRSILGKNYYDDGTVATLTHYDGNFDTSPVGSVISFKSQDYYSHTVADVSDCEAVVCNFWYDTDIHYYGIFTDENDIVLERDQFYIADGIYTSNQQIVRMEGTVPSGAKKFYLVSATTASNFAARTKIVLCDFITFHEKIDSLETEINGTESAYGTQTGNYIGERINLKKQDHTFGRSAVIDVGTIYSGSDFSSDVAQGMAIFNGIAFGLLKNGGCILLDLSTKTIVAAYQLPGYGSDFHANSADFSDEFYDTDDEFPLLYVSKTNGNTDSPCYVFRVSRTGASLIQTISFDNGNGDYTGSFDWILDLPVGTTNSSYRKFILWGNGANGTHPMKVLPVPAITSATVIYTEADVTKEFLLETYLPPSEKINVYQGHTVYQNYLFLVDGQWQNNKIYCFNKNSFAFVGRLASKTLMPYEFEDVAVYDGMLYSYQLSPNDYGQYYKIDFTS